MYSDQIRSVNVFAVFVTRGGVSVCLSFICWYRLKTNNRRIVWFSLTCTQGTSFWDQISCPKISHGNPLVRASSETGEGKNGEKRRFSTNKSLYLGKNRRYTWSLWKIKLKVPVSSIKNTSVSVGLDAVAVLNTGCPRAGVTCTRRRTLT